MARSTSKGTLSSSFILLIQMVLVSCNSSEDSTTNLDSLIELLSTGDDRSNKELDPTSPYAEPQCTGETIESGSVQVGLPNGAYFFDAPPAYGSTLAGDQDFASYDLDSYRAYAANESQFVFTYVYGDNGFNNPYVVIPNSADMLADAYQRGRQILSEAGYQKFSAPGWIYNANWSGGAWVHAFWPSWGHHYAGHLVTRGWTVTMYGFHDNTVPPIQRGAFDPRYRIGEKTIQTRGDAQKNYTLKMRLRAKASGMILADGKPADRHNEILKLTLGNQEPQILNRTENLVAGNQIFNDDFETVVAGQTEMTLSLDNQDHFQFTGMAEGEWIPIGVIKEEEVGAKIDYALCDETKAPTLPLPPKRETL